MTIEVISAAFKKEMASLKSDTELKFESMNAMFQNHLQLILGNQASFFTQVQNEIKSNDKQTRLVLNSLIDEVAEFKSRLNRQDGPTVPRDEDVVSPLTSGSDIAGVKRKGLFLIWLD
jgi:hypothetical protein